MIPVVHKRRLRHREPQSLAQSHTAGWNLDRLAPVSALTQVLHCPFSHGAHHWIFGPRWWRREKLSPSYLPEKSDRMGATDVFWTPIYRQICKMEKTQWSNHRVGIRDRAQPALPPGFPPPCAQTMPLENTLPANGWSIVEGSPWARRIMSNTAALPLPGSLNHPKHRWEPALFMAALHCEQGNKNGFWGSKSLH